MTKKEQLPRKIEVRPIEQDDGRVLTPKEVEEERKRRFEEDWREPNP